MKKIILMILFCLTLSFAIAIAEPIYFPLPINGRITGEIISGLDIKVTNLRTNKILIAETNDYGEYLIDWANSDDDNGAITKYLVGDTFQIEILYCSDESKCIQTIYFSGQPEIYVEFVINEGDIDDPNQSCPSCPSYPSCPTCPTCPTCPGGGNGGDSNSDCDCPDYTCPDIPQCPDNNCPSCPSCPEVPDCDCDCEPSIECPEVPEYPSCPTCPNCPGDVNWIGYLISLALGGIIGGLLGYYYGCGGKK